MSGERQTVLDTLNDAKRAVDDGLELFPGVYPVVRFGVQVPFSDNWFAVSIAPPFVYKALATWVIKSAVKDWAADMQIRAVA